MTDRRETLNPVVSSPRATGMFTQFRFVHSFHILNNLASHYSWFCVDIIGSLPLLANKVKEQPKSSEFTWGGWILTGMEKAENTQVKKFGRQISAMLHYSRTVQVIRAHFFLLEPLSSRTRTAWWTAVWSAAPLRFWIFWWMWLFPFHSQIMRVRSAANSLSSTATMCKLKL